MRKKKSQQKSKVSLPRNGQRRARAPRMTAKCDAAIRELLNTPARFLRSVHLERDFNDPSALEQYVLTPTMLSAFDRILEGVRDGSGRRAWRITGDYGSGKSSFALILAHLLRDPYAPAMFRIRKSMDAKGTSLKGVRMVPILVTGARESLVPAVARAVGVAIERLRNRGRPPKVLGELLSLASQVAKSADVGLLVELLSSLSAYVVGAGFSGVVLIVDELGKFLEFSALHPDREDVYTLQRIAEAAVRSGDRPLLVLGLLHQGFHAYSERLPASAKLEWEKVAERFDELVFDQPLQHTAALLSGALNVDVSALPDSVRARARLIRKAVEQIGWMGSRDASSSTDREARSAGGERLRVDARDPLLVYPLHPTLLPVLLRFFARFGQNERSLFSFLLSSEPFGLQHFASRRAEATAWYRLSDFYDYVRAVFGHRLAGASFKSQWLRIAGVIDGLQDVSGIELQVLKTIAVLNLLDADHLVATADVLHTAVCDGESRASTVAIAALRKRGVLFERGGAGGYRLWPSTSVNLEATLEAARRARGATRSVAEHVQPFLEKRPLLARRHSIQTGTLRHFELRYADITTLRDVVAAPCDSDGVVVVALCDTLAQRYEALGVASLEEVMQRPEVLIAVTPPLIGLAAELDEAIQWQWVANNTPELAHDSYAAAEVARHLSASKRILAGRLAAFTGLQVSTHHPSVTEDAATWVSGGQTIDVRGGRGIQPVLSDICDVLYSSAPRIRNELLNRRTLSSPAAAARMRLIERLFTSSNQSILGIDPTKAPPEKSMYLSVLAAGRLHREVEGRFLLGEPTEGDDPLNLRPALRRILEVLEASGGQRVPVLGLLRALEERPFGVRAGVSPLLLAFIANVHAHELAVYENGTFLQHFGPSDYLRLIKVPTAFEFQLCRVEGVRLEVFNHLVDVFAHPRRGQRRAELLDVVTPLCVFAAQLPEFTRKATNLSRGAAGVRDALLAAREPGPLLFQELPLACDLEPFRLDEEASVRRVGAFVDALRHAMDELRGAFPEMLRRFGAHVTSALGEAAGANGLPIDRANLEQRGRKVALMAREPRLRAFAHRIADAGLAEDSWAEALGSFVVAKPPVRWAPGDELRACDEVDVLAGTFRRVEAIAFASDPSGQFGAQSSVRVGLTRADGSEVVRVVHASAGEQALIDATAQRLRLALPGAAELRLAILAQLLWADMDIGAEVADDVIAKREDEVAHRSDAMRRQN